MTQILPLLPVGPSEGDLGHEPGAIPSHLRPSAARAAAVARVYGVEVLPAQPGPEPAEPAERHLRIVDRSYRTPQQRRNRARLLLLGGVCVVTAIAFSLVYLHVLLAQRQFRLDRLNSQVQQQQVTYQKLRLQVAELGSPGHVISMAEGQLGMVQPASVNYLTPSTTIPSAAPVAATGTPLGGPGTAPAGDADWPAIKSQLAGSP